MKEILEAFKYWLIDKFEKEEENPLIEEIHFLRLQLEKKDIEIKRLTDKIIQFSEPQIINKEVENFDDVESINKNSYIPWNVKKRQLEEEDRKKGYKIKLEAEEALNKNKSTEQLEKEIISEFDELVADNEGVTK